MRLLLTGADGFVGRNIKEYVKDYHAVFSPSKGELNLLDAGAVKNYFESCPVDCIIHCAACGVRRITQDDASVAAKNATMFENILRAKAPDVRVIVFGSGAQYDRRRDLIKVRESELGKYVPAEPYGEAKMRIAQRSLQREDVLCLVTFGCYGKWELETRFPTYAVMQNLRRQPIVIKQNVVFDYIYIIDLCKIVSYFIENWPRKRVINTTPNEGISLLDITQMVNEIGVFQCPVHIENKELGLQYTGNNATLRQEIPGLCFTSHSQGIAELFQWLSDTHMLPPRRYT